MRELEVRILEVDSEKLFKVLESLGAERIFDGELASYYYDRDGEFNTGEKSLRVRREGNEVFLAFKHHLTHDILKDATEHEVLVSDLDTTRKILESLGFSCSLKTRKFRVSYKLDDCRIEFDSYQDAQSFIPTFIEIEGPSEDSILSVAAKLGFSKEDFCNRPIMEIEDMYRPKG